MAKFKNGKLFGLIKKLSPIISGIPIFGPIAANILDDNSTPSGVMDNKELKPQIVAAILTILAALALSGVISWGDAEIAKDFIK